MLASALMVALLSNGLEMIPAHSESLPGVAIPQLSAAAPTPPPKPADPLVPTPWGHDLVSIERNIVHFTNLERTRRGLRPLAVCPRLMGTARRHCSWMCSSRSLTHGRGVAENIAMGQSGSVDAVNGWMNSSGHRANMLSSKYSRIGVAAFQLPGGQIYFCQQFMP
jgi:uncharacterized protein YkwD